MTGETKMTKTMWYEALKGIVEGSDYEDKDGAIEFIDKQVEQLAVKAEKAKARAAEKKADGDAMREAVEAALTGDFQTIDEITAKVDFEGATKAKVTARLTQLVKAEIATKDAVRVDGRKLTAYKLV